MGFWLGVTLVFVALDCEFEHTCFSEGCPSGRICVAPENARASCQVPCAKGSDCQTGQVCVFDERDGDFCANGCSGSVPCVNGARCESVASTDCSTCAVVIYACLAE